VECVRQKLAGFVFMRSSSRSALNHVFVLLLKTIFCSFASIPNIEPRGRKKILIPELSKLCIETLSGWSALPLLQNRCHAHPLSATAVYGVVSIFTYKRLLLFVWIAYTIYSLTISATQAQSKRKYDQSKFQHAFSYSSWGNIHYSFLTGSKNNVLYYIIQNE